MYVADGFFTVFILKKKANSDWKLKKTLAAELRGKKGEDTSSS
jgi:hypothetical protein